MSEHWKSTPKYWCKHCSCYVRDTKLEKQNHEATGKHQGALKRFLRDLHRGHEREERDKDRAKREIARLNGVVESSASITPGPAGAGPAPPRAPVNDKPLAPSESQLQRQREQLAELGVAMPSQFRPEMAMPGEWTVTNTRVIETTPKDEENKEAVATGIRKREVTEEEKEEEDAMRGLFKRPKKWGRDSRTMPTVEDTDLDALLSGSTFQRIKGEEGQEDVKEEAQDGVKQEEETVEAEKVKTEDAPVKPEMPALDPPIKSEEGTEPGLNPVVFKKRKPKNIRQK